MHPPFLLCLRQYPWLLIWLRFDTYLAIMYVMHYFGYHCDYLARYWLINNVLNLFYCLFDYNYRAVGLAIDDLFIIPCCDQPLVCCPYVTWDVLWYLISLVGVFIHTLQVADQDI